LEYKGGIIAVIEFLAAKKEGEDMPDVAMEALLKGCVVRGIAVGSKQMLEELVELVVAKKLRIPVDQVFDFSDEGVREAFELVQVGDKVVKVCISLE
jgi:NADPH:quinone reductase-like Zn-dependent oxidoreductase